MRQDRLAVVNNIRTGPEMEKELKTPDKDMELLICRYLPDDFVLQRPDEVVAANLRQRATSDWEEGTEQNISEETRKRLMNQDKVKSPEERVMSQVYMLIYLNRATLLEWFQYTDK